MWLRWNKYWPWLCIGLSIVLGFLYLEDGHEWGDDFALYLSQARAFLEGNTTSLQAYNHWSMDHSEGTLGPYLYPQGYPLFLTLYLKFLPFNWVYLKLFQWVIFALSGWIFYRWISNSFNFNMFWIMALMCLYLLHPKIIEFSDKIVSDAWFLVLIVSFFSILYSNDYSPLKAQFLLLLTVILASITRMNGLMLMLSWGLNIVLDNKQFSKILKTSTLWVIAFFALWVIRYFDAENESNHVSELFNVKLNILIQNLAFYFNTIGQYFIWHLRAVPFIGVIFGVIMLFSLVYGIAKKWIGYKEFPILIFVLSNLGLYVLWPIQQGTRFLMPIMPFVGILLFWVWYNMFKEITIGRYKLNSSLGLGFAILFFLQGLATSLYGAKKLNTNKVWNPEAISVYEFIKVNVPDSSVVAFDKPRWLHLATQKKCIRVTTDSFERMADFQYRLDYKPGIYTKIEDGYSSPTSYKIRDTSHYLLVKNWEHFALYKHF